MQPGGHAYSASQSSSRSHGRSKRALRKVDFSLLVCGASGTGKTRFIESLIGRRLPATEPLSVKAPGSNLELRGVNIEVNNDDGTILALHAIETVGFADGLDASTDIAHVAEYLSSKFDEVLAEESRIRRNPKFRDHRVHACVYFIEPTSHGLRELDILTLTALAPLVNVIPVISRADQLTPSEKKLVKNQILDDFNHYHLQAFDFGVDAVDSDSEQIDSEYQELLNAVRNSQPFAISSCTEFDDRGAAVYQRKLPHGVLDVADPTISDLVLLRDTIFASFIADLKDSTRETLYETYRTVRLSEGAESFKHSHNRTSMLTPEELAGHANRIKEAQLQRETLQLRETENQLAREIEDKKRQLLAREKELREMELRLTREQEVINSSSDGQSIENGSVTSGFRAPSTRSTQASGPPYSGSAASLPKAQPVPISRDVPEFPEQPQPPPRSPSRPVSFVGLSGLGHSPTSPLHLRKASGESYSFGHHTSQ